MHRQGYSGKKFPDSADAILEFPNLWKDVMKLDQKKIDPGMRTAWEKIPLVFIRHLYDYLPGRLRSVLLQKGHITKY